jgi:hypothetical protein
MGKGCLPVLKNSIMTFYVWIIEVMKSKGKRDEVYFMKMLKKFHSYAKSKFSEDRIICYGCSLALQLGLQLIIRSKKVNLETPFYSLKSIVAREVSHFSDQSIIKL